MRVSFKAVKAYDCLNAFERSHCLVTYVSTTTCDGNALWLQRVTRNDQFSMIELHIRGELLKRAAY